ncbi:MAG: macrolide ABC transporter ATP-binding protein [Candidatus Aenigmatarchaeota archaeon]|nr:MAG: macrolide ABC transporter ATP-binding protein [Candidatus Aenigmarchaeota archaeon]
MSKVILEVKGVEKIYNPGQPNEVRAVKGIDLKVHKGDFIAIVGPSGSGKTTFLDILGCLLRPSKGKVIIDGKETERLSEDGLARVRREKLGFVFQQYNLIPTFTALENVSLALRVAGKSKKSAEKRARELLEFVGLGKRLNHPAGLLSGGEQQRVAIARALANEPEIILADEPTGNLDSKSGKQVLELMKWLNLEKGYTFVVVTHDPEITRYSNRVIYLKDGKIIKEIIKKDRRIIRLDRLIK